MIYKDAMKELLIIFVVLLILLMLISTFGGSIRQKETFYQVIAEEEAPSYLSPPAFKLPALPSFDVTPPQQMPIPSNPPFDLPAPTQADGPGFVDLTNKIEPFDNSSFYAQV